MQRQVSAPHNPIHALLAFVALELNADAVIADSLILTLPPPLPVLMPPLHAQGHSNPLKMTWDLQEGMSSLMRRLGHQHETLSHLIALQVDPSSLFPKSTTNSAQSWPMASFSSAPLRRAALLRKFLNSPLRSHNVAYSSSAPKLLLLHTYNTESPSKWMVDPQGPSELSLILPQSL